MDKDKTNTGNRAKWWDFSYNLIGTHNKSKNNNNNNSNHDDIRYLIITGGYKVDEYARDEIVYFDCISNNWYKCEQTLPIGIREDRSIVMDEYRSIHIFSQQKSHDGNDIPIHWRIYFYDIISPFQWQIIRLI